ncbi:MAG: SRPBCC family protein [Verrucomicrobia bacterium]|nr:SRPBCC family protein [Verrucomicrobiota bacterium]
MEQTLNITQSDKEWQPDVRQTPQQRPGQRLNVGEAERYSSILGGLGLILAGFARRGSSGVLLGALGAALLQRGVTGHCALYQSLGVSGAKSRRPGVPDNVGIKLEHSIVINRPREEVYRFWRHLPNLARFMSHVERIDLRDERRSHWVVRTPRGRQVEWDAVIINEHPNEMLAWESLPGAQVENAGSVRFEPEPHGQGTIVCVKLEYNPPGGLLGRMMGTLLGEKAELEIQEDLAQLKQMLETGERVEQQG